MVSYYQIVTLELSICPKFKTIWKKIFLVNWINHFQNLKSIMLSLILRLLGVVFIFSIHSKKMCGQESIQENFLNAIQQGWATFRILDPKKPAKNFFFDFDTWSRLFLFVKSYEKWDSISSLKKKRYILSDNFCFRLCYSTFKTIIIY